MPFRKFSSSRLPDSRTFCVYPWMQMVVQTHGQASYCCVAERGGIIKNNAGKPFDVAYTGFREAWNSSAMRDIRGRILQGEEVEGCRRCYRQEELGKTSYRQMHNEEWWREHGGEIEKRMVESAERDGLIEGMPLYLDLRLGSLCNLKCRSCNSFNSSQVEKEAMHLWGESQDFRDLYAKHFHVHKAPTPMQAWYEEERFWSEIDAMLPGIHKIYLTGGEPTLLKGNQRLLRNCVERGLAKQIAILFNTNATKLTEEFLLPLNQFRHAQINVSIDAFGAENEYIRYPSRWAGIEKNMRQLMALPSHISVGVTPVVQVYNILTLTDLLRWIEGLATEFKRKVHVDFLFAFNPEFLNPGILPAPLKNLAADRLEQFRASSKLVHQDHFLRNSIEACLNLLREPVTAAGAKNIEHVDDFLLYTKVLDAERNQDFSRAFPELRSGLQA